MVMRAMRNSAKWVMLILSIAFVGWLVFDWVSSRGGAGLDQINPVVARVGGREIRNNEWRVFLENRLAVARQQTDGSLNEEQARIVSDGAWEELVSTIVLENEIQRLGIEITDAEVQQAFRTRPPPEFQNHPAFQTDGQFDYDKYQQFFAGPAVDQTMLLQLEAYYRAILPRERLANLVAEGVYVSEQDAWDYYRDANETSTVRFVSMDPALMIPDSLVTVPDAAVQEYYARHQSDYVRPASATVNMVTIGTRPSVADTVAARSLADSLRALIVGGGAEFADVARSSSADTLSGNQGGALGSFARGTLEPTLDEVVFSQEVGTVSEPIQTLSGLHLLRVDSRSADSASVRHILVPIALSQATEDSIFDLMDELEGMALLGDLATSADSLGVPVRRNIVLTDGSGFVPGAGALGVAPAWALDPVTVVGDLSQFFENPTGYHIFELLERRDSGTFALEEVEADIRQELIGEAKKAEARTASEPAIGQLQGGTEFAEVALERGWNFQDEVTFRRMDFVPGLGQGTEAIGSAFGLPIGTISGVLDAGEWLAVIQVTDRTEVTREEFEAVKGELRNRLTLERRQLYVQQWLAALREAADVVDYRDQLAAAAAAAQT
jgi:parvulin-like peptidyl-prolyl isomerase